MKPKDENENAPQSEPERGEGLARVKQTRLDRRDPKVLAAIRCEAAMLDKHPDNTAIDAWLETVVDPADWS